ncbi:MAG: squalene/phytoene synthase family protein [Candidatus Zixiibacteriota bacterium]
MKISESKLDFAVHLDFSAILTNPILDIAARVWEEERYEAFRVCYRSMRLIDDLVDTRKASTDPISEQEIAALAGKMDAWLESIRTRKPLEEYSAKFVEVLDRFEMPLWPWERLCRSMQYDLRHNGFATFSTFTRYCEGAAIAPAAIFMHLCGVRRDGNSYRKPSFDIRSAARLLAIFSYITHILRDFEKDQRSHLNYYADSLIVASGCSRPMLEEIALSGSPTPEFRRLMREYARIGEYYRGRARQVVDKTLPLLEERYQLSLELIYALYLQIFRRVDPDNGRFDQQALHPTPAEVEKEIHRVISTFRPCTG